MSAVLSVGGQLAVMHGFHCGPDTECRRHAIDIGTSHPRHFVGVVDERDTPAAYQHSFSLCFQIIISEDRNKDGGRKTRARSYIHIALPASTCEES